MRKRVLVTGANGYIGTHLIKELTKQKQYFCVTALDIDNIYLDKDVNFIKLNIFDEIESSDFFKTFKDYDICVHLAWRDGFKHNSISHINDFAGHFNFLNKLYEVGISHFAVAGSFREYGKVNGIADESKIIIPDNFYTLSKMMLKYALDILFKDKENICFQWFRPFTVYGDDFMNDSIMSKIIKWEKDGKETFPFTDGNEQYDYIHVDELSKQITAIISQRDISGVIDCCSGSPTKLSDKIEDFLKDNNFKIKPEYGIFESRSYDSKVIFGDNTKINKILNDCKFY